MVLELNKSPKKVVNKIIAWLCSLGYLFEFILIVYLFFDGFIERLIDDVTHGLKFMSITQTDVVLLISAILVVLFLVFCLYHYEWVLNPVFEVDTSNKVLKYKSDTVIAVVGKATTEYTIKSVTYYKVKKNSIIVYGNIVSKEPLGKEVERYSCEISCLYNIGDKDKVLAEIKNFGGN